ncbi:MAG TPA: TIGR03086 family metal-binding protein [Acidimicrobiales bacterium]|nr:TIGR03086 family metal-binding protein [Acidimicrobiales bacterium]
MVPSTNTNGSIPELHRRALDGTHGLVAGVREGQWRDPTPCADWDVRELVNHIVAENFWVAPMLAGKSIEDVGAQFDGDVLGDDPLAAYDRSAADAAGAADEPGAMDRPVGVSYGPVPGSVYVGHRFLDVLIHGWDLAKATGQDTSLDPELVQACWDLAEPEEAMLKGSGLFGPADGVPVPDGADLQTRLLALLGRRA